MKGQASRSEDEAGEGGMGAGDGFKETVVDYLTVDNR